MTDADEDDAGAFAVGNFDDFGRLTQVLQETDTGARLELLRAFDIEDEAFASALARTASHCRRGALLYRGLGRLAVSFNGGKDACVVLYIWLAALAAASRSGEVEATQQQTAIFFDSSGEFDEVRAFVAWVVKKLNLKMVTIEEKSFRQGMVDLVGDGLEAVVMGQRRFDPWMRDVDVFSPSTSGWPAFMRINPIIDWTYAQIWIFLRAFGLPYCKLYDEGYTSLGSVRSTQRNPALRRLDGSYDAAWTLEDEGLERAGRVAQQPSATDKDGTTTPATRASHLLIRDRSLSDSPQPRTAGIVSIGNEILIGRVHDLNSHYLCGQLYSRGVAVKRVEVVPDDVPAIANAVRQLSGECDFVFTSGGLGPTHDDVTMAGVAAAFDCNLVTDDRFLNMLVQRHSASGSEPKMAACQKLASVPAGAALEWPEDGNPWPIASMRNVYIFAGMPSVFRAMMERASRDGRFEGARKWVSDTLRLDADEADVLDVLQRTVEAFPHVTIGSYPAATRESGKVVEIGEAARLCITFEAFDVDKIAEARAHLARALPAELIVDASARL